MTYMSEERKPSMSFAEFKAKIMDVTEPTEGVEYHFIGAGLHPDKMPREVRSLGTAADRAVIRFSAWRPGKERVGQPVPPEEADKGLVPVYLFSRGVFAGNETVTDIILPPTIISIPKGAFVGCKNLRRITFPREIRRVPLGSFAGCEVLTDIYYEGTVEEWKQVEIRCEEYVEAEPGRPGLYSEIVRRYVPGNEELLRANVHFRCKLKE